MASGTGVYRIDTHTCVSTRGTFVSVSLYLLTALGSVTLSNQLNNSPRNYIPTYA